MASVNPNLPDILKSLNINYPKLAMVTIVLLLLDYIWISKVSNNLYFKTINNVQKSKFKMNSSKYAKAGIAYILIVYLLAINYNKSFYERMFLGIAVYGIFNFTNATMFDKWTNEIALIDTAWGGVLFSAVPYIADFLGCGDKKLIL